MSYLSPEEITYYIFVKYFKLILQHCILVCANIRVFRVLRNNLIVRYFVYMPRFGMFDRFDGMIMS